ncbi:MAG: hypothetical protein M3281_03965 [Chloroflexota bacterium]|nr:hypothetical protein [Chloroflexota bacterium]
MPESTPRLEKSSSELQPLRGAYLELWIRYKSQVALLTALSYAGRLAALNGAWTCHRLVSRPQGPAREDHAEPVPALLREFLDIETVASG